MKARHSRWLTVASLFAAALGACGPSRNRGDSVDAATSEDASPDVYSCPRQCSADQRSVLDCDGNKLTDCGPADACDVSQTLCTNACTAAEANHRSIGCDYYAVHMDSLQPNYCFAAFVANTWTSPA